MRLVKVVSIGVLALALALTACLPGAPTPTPTPTPGAPAAVPVPGGPANFRLLLSDQPNAIGDFQSLVVTLSRIGVLLAAPGPTPGGEGLPRWFEVQAGIPQVDLVLLQGKNAQEVWRGTLPPGKYLKVFIYVTAAEGTLKDGTKVAVKLPSGALGISKPFEVQIGKAVNFVFDFSVVKAGKADGGFEYLLLPQIGDSGTEQTFREVKVRGRLKIGVAGTIEPGKTITITVTDPQGNPLAGAPVTINDQLMGSTNDKGQLDYPIPAGAEEIEIKVAFQGPQGERLRGELEIDLEEMVELKGKLFIKVDGDIQPGKTVTITVLDPQGKPAAGAAVRVKGVGVVGTTNDKGQVQFTLPQGMDELEIKARSGNLEGELEIELEEIEVKPKGRLNLTLEGEVKPGAKVTLTVTSQGQPVAGATVTLNKQVVGTTNDKGQVQFTIPPGMEELEIKARLGDQEGKMEIKLEKAEGRLGIKVEGAIEPGKTITITVTDPQGQPVAGAPVTINNQIVGTTNDKGQVQFTIPPGMEELEIKARLGNLKGEMEIKLKKMEKPREALNLAMEGEIKPGGKVSLTVTSQGQPVAGAQIILNGIVVGNTDAKGRLSFTLPPDAEKAKIKARSGKQEGEMELRFKGENGGGKSEGGDK